MAGILQNAVAAALKAVGSALPELSKTMTADGVTAAVVLASSVDEGTDAASSSGANETRRVVAQVADFPKLSPASLVEIDGDAHVITSLKATGEAAWFVGLSRGMESTAVEYRGTRREGTRVRSFAETLPALVAEGDSLEPTYTDAAAFNQDRGWYVVIREKDWVENVRPEIGDTIAVERGARVLHVATIEPHDGYFTIYARS